MGNGFALFINIAPAAVIILIVAFITVLPYRKEPAAQSLLWYFTLCIWLLLTNIGELLAPSGKATIFFAKLEYIAFLYIPIAWLSFSLRYTGWITTYIKPLITVAIVGPAIGILVVFTNDMHGLLWQSIRFIEWHGFSVLKPEYGPLYWIAFSYSWLSIGLGSLIILRSYVIGESLYHRQSLWIVTGTLLPAITNLINVTRSYHGIIKDFTPIGFALSGIFFLIGMYFHRLFWIMPVSRGAILQEIDVGILVLDRKGKIVDHNKSVDTLLSLHEILVGKDYTQCPLLKQLLEEINFEPGSQIVESQTGQTYLNNRYLKCKIQPSKLPREGTFLILEDISAQVQLINENVYIKNEYMKRETLATIGKLAASLAHEINNPLGYIKSDIRSFNDLSTQIIQELKNEEKNEIHSELLHITAGIYEGLSRIEEVTRSLLNFTRRESFETAFEMISLHDCIETTLKIMRTELQRNAELIKKYGEIPLIWGQKQAINQVFFNLFSNALQALEAFYNETGKRGILEIRTGAADATVWCEIMDTGKPIAPDQVDKLFDLFYTTKKDGYGTGIGLNLCKEIIEKKHNGRLFITSTDPVTFRIELPIQGRVT